MVNKCSHTVDDFLSVKRASDVEISKDGSKVAFMVSGTFKNFKEEFVSEIMTQSIKDGKERTFSRQGWMNFSPKFSPSGNKLAYLSKKEEEYRLLIYDFLKESDQEIVVEGEANDLQWADDKSLIVQIKDKDSLKEEKRNGNDAYFFEEEPRFDSLWMYESESGFRRITSGRQIWEFNVNKYLVAAITSSFPFEWSWYEAEVSLIDLKDGIVKKIYSKKERQVAKPRLSPDNKKVTFLESLWSDRGVNSGDILSIDINSRKPKNLTEGGKESYSEVQWISENEF